ncbi:MAG TPA: ferrous iron transporter B [Methanothrix sp.]|uniref:ferrous iron transporter B n=2 Tax=Methanothrix sp. TaxID=90426 RepID=UPI002B72D96F|nr:ferrous iron transporter B [Methanothrix sp.]MDI9416517.1 ferrous iron transporter B [Euryarchaeota archaeon]HON35905.1 ferrous iron transporter B [Methanothrix sp.]HON36401.1 ferrous iron transporter B [Methanothrix sp.]HRU75611.1 ferrous iron transporter B [Methanothrix sp.]
MKILLMGNPNVGKSVIFSRLTGIEVVSANYPGTTIEYTEGRMKLGERMATLVDPPGVYSLEPTSKVEEVTGQILEQGADVVVNVIDSTNLERNLNLTLQILERGIPTVVALNLWDVATRKGIEIDTSLLAEELGVDVVPTVAVSGQGIYDLVEAIGRAKVPHPVQFESSDQRWVRIGEISERCQRVLHRHPSLLDRLEDISLKPWTGIPIALLLLYLSFSLVIEIGEMLQLKVTDPFFTAYSIFITDVVHRHISSDLIREILVGSSPELLKSFGILTTGLYIPLGIVLPFLIPFYLLLGMLEDIGYLPRLSVILDAFMHRIGLHGAAILPCVLGMGCSVPAVLSVRILESAKQRYLAATLMTMAIPCASQSAMIFGILAPHGLRYIFIVYATLFLSFVVTGYLLHRLIGGESPEIFMEIPPYRMPNPKALSKKTFVRVREFLKEAVPYIGLGMLIMNFFYLSGLMHLIGEELKPVVSGLLGLPSDAATALIIGFLRKDVGIGMFAPLDMSPVQYVIAAVVLAMYMPCVATFMVMLKELGVSGTAKSVALRLVAALVVGTALNLILN